MLPLHGPAICGCSFGTSKVPPQGGSCPAGGTEVVYSLCSSQDSQSPPTAIPAALLGDAPGSNVILGFIPSGPCWPCPSGVAEGSLWVRGPTGARSPKSMYLPEHRVWGVALSLLSPRMCSKWPGTLLGGSGWPGGSHPLTRALPAGCLPPYQLLPAPACPQSLPPGTALGDQGLQPQDSPSAPTTQRGGRQK